MSKITKSQLLPQAKDIKDKITRRFCHNLVFALDVIFRKIADIPFNESETVSVTDSGSADTEFTVTHHLGRVPEGFLIANIDKGGSVYDSGTSWTSTTVYLKCSAANAAIDVIVF